MDETRSGKPSRYQSLDAWRGALIILMALDHANYHIAHQHSSGEYWGGAYPAFASSFHFFTRFVTHFCAPGFFFLLGVGMVLFQNSRRKKGWKGGQIRSHFLLRGLVLIALQLLLNLGGIWSAAGSNTPILYGGVLAALGAGMIICAMILDQKPVILVFIGLGLMFTMEILTPPMVMWGRNFDQLPGVLLVFGGGEGELWVNYPLFAWVELIVFGIVFGRLLLRDQKQSHQWGVRVGLACLAGFVIVRCLNGFGTIRALDTRGWMEFFSLVKYPPSIAFVLLTMGVNLLLFGVFSQIFPNGLKWGNPLLVFGRTPLFSYVGHILIYLVLGRLFTPEGTSLWVMYLFWLAGLGLLYFPAKWYRDYKSGKPIQSWVRLF